MTNEEIIAWAKANVGRYWLVPDAHSGYIFDMGQIKHISGKSIRQSKMNEIKRLEDKLATITSKELTEKIEARIEELELSGQYEGFEALDV